MDRKFLRGFFKFAQEEETEVAQPEEDNKETVTTCMSDCTYAQNPEKRCMLESISLSMDEKSGTFACGQYVQAQELQEEQPAAQQEAPIKTQPGLPGQPVSK